MTFKEFRQRVLAISRDEFIATHSRPLEHGIERAHFEEEKLKRLIAVARQAKFVTARRRLEAWQRQLEKVRSVRERLECTNANVFPNSRKSRRVARVHVPATVAS